MTFTCMACRPTFAQQVRLTVPLCLGLAFGAHAAGAGDPWFKYEYEENFVEAGILIVLVTLALLFETSWRSVTDKAKASYRYGMIHDDAFGTPHALKKDGHGNIRHHVLLAELTTRAGAEFMILGFLAFLVFLFNQLSGFSMLLQLLPTKEEWHMPRDSYDWLHTVERVHMQLFVGMVLYFILMFQIINGSTHKIKEWENARLRQMRNTTRDTPHSHRTWGPDPQLDTYNNLREYFLLKIPAWKKKRPALFKQVLELFGVDKANADTLSQLPEIINNRFAFAAYLSLNVESGVLDSIEVQPLTWFCVMGALAGLAGANRMLNWTLTNLSYGLLGFVFSVLFGMRCLVGYRLGKIAKKMRAHRDAKEGGIDGDPVAAVDDSPVRYSSYMMRRKREKKPALKIFQRLNMEICVMRLLQTVMILSSYAFASRLGNINGWRTQPAYLALVCLLLGVAFGMLGYFLPVQVPNFLCLMALPPFDNEDNMIHFFGSLMDDHSPLSYARDDAKAEVTRKLTKRSTYLLAKTEGASKTDAAMTVACKGDTEFTTNLKIPDTMPAQLMGAISSSMVAAKEAALEKEPDATMIGAPVELDSKEALGLRGCALGAPGLPPDVADEVIFGREWNQDNSVDQAFLQQR